MSTATIDFVDRYLQAIENKENFTVCTVIDVRDPDGTTANLLARKVMISEGNEVTGDLGHAKLQASVLADARDLIRLGRSKTVTYNLDGSPTGRRDRAVRNEPGIDVYFEVTQGQLTLIVVGGGHVGACLAKVAHYAGWRIVVVDDREAFANRERFPDADEILCKDYDEALRDYPIGPSTYVVAVTRGHKHDEIALRAVVESDARYVGMIGSKRRVGTVLRHLREEGVSQESLDKVWTPIGLDIEAETPEEIAISIVAEMIMVRRGGKGGPMALKERRKTVATPDTDEDEQ
jgi:xanthine dehydrogenase accessory factor